MTEAEVLRRAVEHHFAPGQRQRALAVLASYGEQPHERELARVRFDAVALARGDLAELERVVEHARLDYRDVLLWAEYEKDPVLGEMPRARLLRVLGLADGDPATGRTSLGN